MSVVLSSVPALPVGLAPATREAYNHAKLLQGATWRDADDFRRAFAAAMFRCDGVAMWALASLSEERGLAPTVVSTYLRCFLAPEVTTSDPDAVVQKAGAAYINLLIPLVQARM